MNYQLSIYELGKILNNIQEKYEMKLLTKIKLSGGWMTMTGKVEVEYVPTNQVMIKGNNIISLKVINNEQEGSSIKITGQKDGKFIIDLAPTKYKEIHKGGLNIDQIKEKDNQCTLKIDDDMVFTINASYDEIVKLL